MHIFPTRLALLMYCLAAGCRPGATSQVAEPPASTAGEAREPGYVGSKTCRDCHQEFYRLWSTSYHGLAMQPYTPELAQEHLTAQADDIAIGNRKYRAEIGPGQGLVRETGPNGEKKYPIAHVMGGKNVYYFLTPLDRGRLQVLPVAYDVHKRSWYDVAASGVRHFSDRRDEALDWTDRLYTFNTTCFNCHVSELSTNYDLASDTYHTSWAEPGISCESCHGPAGEHNRAMEAQIEGPREKGDGPRPTFGRCPPERPEGGHRHAALVVAQLGTVPFFPESPKDIKILRAKTSRPSKSTTRAPSATPS